MQEYTEAEAYKHLLSVAENILNSVQTDSNILEKYNKLKSAVLTKISNDSSSQQLSVNKKLLQSYKYITSSFIDVISEFEGEIQNQMDRQLYSKKVIGIVKEWELRIDELKMVLGEIGNQKQKLVLKEEVSALSYYCSELDSLLIEVHKKMHEIICQASQTQSDKSRKEQQMYQSLRNLQEEVNEVRNAKRFLQKHRMAEQKYKEFKLWSSKLSGLLFQR